MGANPLGGDLTFELGEGGRYGPLADGAGNRGADSDENRLSDSL